MTEIALAELALKYLPVVVSGAEKLWAWITSVRSASQQSAEWTPEIEAQYQAALLARTGRPEYQPDTPPAP